MRYLCERYVLKYKEYIYFLLRVPPIRRTRFLPYVLLLISASNGVFTPFLLTHTRIHTHVVLPSRSHAKFSGFLCCDKKQKTRRWLPAQENLCMLHNFGLYYFSVGQWHAQDQNQSPKPKTKKKEENPPKKIKEMKIKRRQKGDCNSI